MTNSSRRIRQPWPKQIPILKYYFLLLGAPKKTMNKFNLIKNYFWFMFHAPPGYRKSKDFKLCSQEILSRIFKKRK